MSAARKAVPPDTRSAVWDLLGEYAYLIDEDRLEDWVECFTDDCLYRIVPRENLDAGLPAALLLCEGKDMLRDRVAYLRKAALFNIHRDRHILGHVRIEEDGADLRATTGFAVYQSSQEGVSALFCVGYYLDRITSRDGRLLFREKTVVLETATIPTLLSTPL